MSPAKSPIISGFFAIQTAIFLCTKTQMHMYQLLRSNKPVRSLLSLAVIAVMIPLLFSVFQADPDNIGDAFLLGAPWQAKRSFPTPLRPLKWRVRCPMPSRPGS